MTEKAMEPLTQDLINEVSTLKQQIGQAKEENENLRTKIQVQKYLPSGLLSMSKIIYPCPLQSSKHAPVSTSKKSQTVSGLSLK